MTDSAPSRRALLRATGAAAAAALAGCSGDGGSPCTVEGADASVAVGPLRENVFEPERVTVAAGETVGWCVEGPGHNVSAVPDHADAVSLPDGAEPFASYGGDAKYRTLGVGETFTYRFETPGTYTYVCVPHASQGMVGTVVVE